MDILIINGPNLNLLGTREKNIYGDQTFEDFFANLIKTFPHVNLTYFQSNIEGELVDKLHEARNTCQAVLLNAGAYTHTSIAISDAIAGIQTPVLEIHISNIYSREEFRHKSIISKECVGMISGLGLKGYELGIQYFIGAEK